MASPGTQFLVSVGRPATYTAPGGSPISCRAIIKDVSAELRLARTADLIRSDAVASVDAAINPRRGGIIEVSGTRYEITGTLRSGAPGLIDLGLIRFDGEGVEVHDFAPAVLTAWGEPVELIDNHGDAPRTVQAMVNRSGLVIEDDGMGNGVETLRYSIALRLSDLGDLGGGSLVRVDGEDRPVLRVMRDGVSMARVIC